jgi:hypothetical protein
MPAGKLQNHTPLNSRGGNMTTGDAVVVIDQRSDCYGQEGQIVGANRTGELCVRVGEMVYEFDAHQLELSALVSPVERQAVAVSREVA